MVRSAGDLRNSAWPPASPPPAGLQTTHHDRLISATLVETSRFHYWTDDEDLPLSDGWWFWKQAEACAYELPPGRTWERDLRWEVPAAARTSTPGGLVPTHGDRLISAALVAVYDELVVRGVVRIGRGESRIMKPTDPLDDLGF